MKDALFQVSLASFCFFLGITLLSFISFIKDKTLPVKWAKVSHFSLYSLPTHKGRYFSFCYVRCLFFSRGTSCLWHSFLALLLPQSFSFECQWSSCPFCDCFVPSVIILSLQWSSSSSSFEFAIHNYLLLEGYKQNCQVVALDVRFKGPKFPGLLYKSFAQ